MYNIGWNVPIVPLILIDVFTAMASISQKQEGMVMKRSMVLILSLALVLALANIALADTPVGGVLTTLRITINPRWGPVGTLITVYGEGAQADKPVKVAFTTSGEWGTDLTTVEITPNIDGTFQTTVTVPEGTAEGTYAVRAWQINPLTGNVLQYWYSSFVVSATPPVMPITGAEGLPPVRATAVIGEVLLVMLVGAGLFRWVKP